MHNLEVSFMILLVPLHTRWKIALHNAVSGTMIEPYHIIQSVEL